MDYTNLIIALESARALTPAADVATASTLDIMLAYYRYRQEGGTGTPPMTPGP